MKSDEPLKVHDDHPKGDHFHWAEGIANPFFAPGSSHSSDTLTISVIAYGGIQQGRAPRLINRTL
jgi:hypothetical protein